MLDIDISDPKIDPEELFRRFVNERLHRDSFWSLMEVWSWSLGPISISKDPVVTMQEEEDRKIFLCLIYAYGISESVFDAQMLIAAWVAAGWISKVSKDGETFGITSEGQRILKDV
jgi:hypothetical protein